MSANEALSRRDYEDLAKLARRQEKVAKTMADQRAAELLADTEAQLAAVFGANDERWRHVAERVTGLIETANAEVERICIEAGVRPQFAPSFNVYWSRRGENAEKDRRAELRRVAETRIEAMRQRARAEIERRTVEFEGHLLGGMLETGAARELLAAMPKAAEALMPRLDAAELDSSVPVKTGQELDRWSGG